MLHYTPSRLRIGFRQSFNIPGWIRTLLRPKVKTGFDRAGRAMA